MDRWFEEARNNAMPGVVTYLVSYSFLLIYFIMLIVSGWEQIRQDELAGGEVRRGSSFGGETQLILLRSQLENSREC